MDFEFIVDSREPKKLLLKAKQDYSNAIIKELHSADFACKQNHKLLCGLERKQLEDFVNSMRSKKLANGKRDPPRLLKQLNKLVIDYPIVFLILEGQLDKLYVKYNRLGLHFNESAFWGMITSISVRDNVHIIWTPRIGKTLDVAYRICQKMAEGKYQLPRRIRPKNASKPKDLLELIPGVTPEVAQNLLKEFNNIQGIASQNVKSLKAIQSVGPTKAKNIKRYLCKNDFNNHSI